MSKSFFRYFIVTLLLDDNSYNGIKSFPTRGIDFTSSNQVVIVLLPICCLTIII